MTASASSSIGCRDSGTRGLPHAGHLAGQFINVAEKHLCEVPERGGVVLREFFLVMNRVIAADPHVVGPVFEVGRQLPVGQHPFQSGRHHQFGRVRHHGLRRNVERRPVHGRRRIPHLHCEIPLAIQEALPDRLRAVHRRRRLRYLRPDLAQSKVPAHIAFALGWLIHNLGISMCRDEAHWTEASTTFAKADVHVQSLWNAVRVDDLKRHILRPAMRAIGREYCHG